MFNQPITIVNKYYNNGVLNYKCTQLKGFFYSTKSVNTNGYDITPIQNYVCRILMSEKGYVEPSKFNGNGWTLQTDDYIVKGSISQWNSSLTNNYFKITNVAVKDYGSKDMQHYEIN